MKNNTKLIMETWRRFMKEGPQIEESDINEPFDFSGEYVDGKLPQIHEPPFEDSTPVNDNFDEDLESDVDGFDRVTQGPEAYVSDEQTILAIVDMLNSEPHLSPEDIKNKLGMDDIDEEIAAARERYANSQMTSGEEDYDPIEAFEVFS